MLISTNKSKNWKHKWTIEQVSNADSLWWPSGAFHLNIQLIYIHTIIKTRGKIPVTFTFFQMQLLNIIFYIKQWLLFQSQGQFNGLHAKCAYNKPLLVPSLAHMEITSIKRHQQVVSTSTEIIKVKENRRQKWKVRRKQEEAIVMLEDKSSLEETGCSVTKRTEIFIIPLCLYSPPTCHSSQYYVRLSVTRSDSLIRCSSLGVS